MCTINPTILRGEPGPEKGAVEVISYEGSAGNKSNGLAASGKY